MIAQITVATAAQIAPRHASGPGRISLHLRLDQEPIERQLRMPVMYRGNKWTLRKQFYGKSAKPWAGSA
jgi:hypothetical protein